MKEVTIEGVRYLPANKLAKEFRYTTDYIGQLCRAKKVDAQLVGRSWYVNPISLTAHKSNKHKKVSSANKDSNIAHNIKLSRMEVVRPNVINDEKATPVTVNHGHESSNSSFSKSNYIKRLNWQPLKYEEDAGDLIPEVKGKVNQPKKIDIDLAESTDITIKSTTESTKLIAEDLPEVSLQGTLKVSNIEEYFDDSSINSENEDILLPEEVLEEDNTENRVSLRKLSSSRSKTDFRHRMPKKKPVSLIPTQHSRKYDAELLLSVEEGPSEHRLSRFVFYSSTSILVVIVLLSVFVESTLLANSVSYQNEVHFSKPSSAALVSLFSEESY